MEENTNNIPTPEVNETASEPVVNSILEVREDMTRDELLEVSLKALKKSEDQEKRALKAEAKLKATAEESQPATPSEQKPKQSTAGSGLSFEEVELINKGYTKQELETARKYAQAFGMSVSSAAEDAGFKAKIQREREMRQAADALISGAPAQTSRISEDDFEKGVINGSIDITENEGNRKRYTDIVKRKAVR